MDQISFHDVTNVGKIKHQVCFQNSFLKAEEEHVVTLGMVKKMSENLYQLSQKIDAVHELLLSLVSQQAQGVSPTLPFVPLDRGADMFCAVVGDGGSNAVCMVDGGIKPHHVQMLGVNSPELVHQPIATVEEIMPNATARNMDAVRDAESRKEHRKKEKVLTASERRDDGNSWMKRNCFIVLVEFKCQRVKRCESSFFIVPGQYAIVQGDRGHDCGVVNQCSEWSAEKSCFMREECFDGSLMDVTRMKNAMGRVVRVATEAEVELLFGEIARNENLALKACREIVARLKLDMNVVDCEYQFDQQKISFYYEASRSIDFRQLNSELYRIFGVRIWLQNVNNAVKNVVPAGAMSRDDKAQYQRSGLRHPSFK